MLKRTGRTGKNQTAYPVLKSIHQIKVCQAVDAFESVLNEFFDKERAVAQVMIALNYMQA